MARVAGAREEAAFSSLSRDNLAPQELGPGRGCTDFQLPLSGSLGGSCGLLKKGDEIVFQLPLSGSPRRAEDFMNAAVNDFQLPLSGSPCPGDQDVDKIRIDDFQLPLSGSQELPAARAEGPAYPFNSLSRDHRARFRDFSALRGVLPRHLFAQMISKATI
jgi:hypothetical protein